MVAIFYGISILTVKSRNRARQTLPEWSAAKRHDCHAQ
jgi:hypothetical protein